MALPIGCQQETSERSIRRTRTDRPVSCQLNDDYMPSLGKIVQTAALKLSAQLGGRRSR
jgi:hypothetical protein